MHFSDSTWYVNWNFPWKNSRTAAPYKKSCLGWTESPVSNQAFWRGHAWGWQNIRTGGPRGGQDSAVQLRTLHGLSPGHLPKRRAARAGVLSTVWVQKSHSPTLDRKQRGPGLSPHLRSGIHLHGEAFKRPLFQIEEANKTPWTLTCGHFFPTSDAYLCFGTLCIFLHTPAVI